MLKGTLTHLIFIQISTKSIRVHPIRNKPDDAMNLEKWYLALKWFENNLMKANPFKFQSIIFSVVKMEMFSLSILVMSLQNLCPL